MTSKTLSAGDIIESRCTRCRAVLNHTIVAMVGDKVARVECNTCGGVHNYKEPKAAKPAKAETAKKSPTPRKPRKDPAAAERQEWAALHPTLDREKARPYDMTAPYRAKELIDHPTFGLGIVERTAGPNKIEVLFQDGRKLLRCG